MNKIVRQNYPVSELPEDLRRELSGHDMVTLTLEASEPVVEDRSGPEPPYGWGGFSRYRHLAQPNYKSVDEVVAHIRALRDEWGERDQSLNTLRDQ